MYVSRIFVPQAYLHFTIFTHVINISFKQLDTSGEILFECNTKRIRLSDSCIRCMSGPSSEDLNGAYLDINP